MFEEFKQRFAPRTDVEAERARVEVRTRSAVQQLSEEARRTGEEHQQFLKRVATERQTLVSEYEAAKAIHESLCRQIALLEENIEDLSFGLYKPHFNFDPTEAYKAALQTCRDGQPS